MNSIISKKETYAKYSILVIKRNWSIRALGKFCRIGNNLNCQSIKESKRLLLNFSIVGKKKYSCYLSLKLIQLYYIFWRTLRSQASLQCGRRMFFGWEYSFWPFFHNLCAQSTCSHTYQSLQRTIKANNKPL